MPSSGGTRAHALKVPGMPCPSCSTPIVIDPMVLLAAVPIECPACGLELRVNTEKSAGTLKALSAYMQEYEALQSAYQKTVSEMTGERKGRKVRGERGPRRRPRRPRRTREPES
jgi:hypothetical protein